MPLWSSIADTVHVCTCSNINKISERACGRDPCHWQVCWTLGVLGQVPCRSMIRSTMKEIFVEGLQSSLNSRRLQTSAKNQLVPGTGELETP